MGALEPISLEDISFSILYNTSFFSSVIGAQMSNRVAVFNGIAELFTAFFFPLQTEASSLIFLVTDAQMSNRVAVFNVAT